MAKRASISRTIRYAHVPKSPVIDPVTNKWTYEAAPTAARLEESVAQLNAINDNAAVAITKADAADTKAIAAKTAADNAKSVADTKVTAGEAVTAARDSMFMVTMLDNKNPNGINVNNAKMAIEFRQVSEGGFYIFLYPEGKPDNPSSANAKWLDYASKDSFDMLYGFILDLQERVAAIEQQLGISS